MTLNKVVVTGGAGFIGSNLAISLSTNHCVDVIDNLSTSLSINIKSLSNHGVKLKKLSLQSRLPPKLFQNCSAVFHLASLSDVKESMEKPTLYFENNVQATINLLESMRKNDVKKIIFTSSSVVYGETATPANEQSTLKPISIYAMTKLFCESLIESYCNLYGFQGVILRLANIVGENSPKGLIHDMMVKFNKNPNKIIILGDGKQTKSYLHVNDCVDAILISYKNMNNQKSNPEIFNVSSNFLDVNSVVKIIGDTLGHHSFQSIYKKFDDNGRGWFGDITKSKMSTSKLRKLGWVPSDSRQTIKSIIQLMREN